MCLQGLDPRYRWEPSAGIAVGFTTVYEIKERRMCRSSNPPSGECGRRTSGRASPRAAVRSHLTTAEASWGHIA